ncbi:MAG: tetratricopeptide repeat protein [Deltaproteobacteria bacterium]|nr:tetratricopeptide repeat protein [Deltaproteobacteria bacterium]
MTRSCLLALGLAALLATSSSAETGGVKPDAPQAEDKPDVGDGANAPVVAPPVVAPQAAATEPWADGSEQARYEAYADAFRSYEEHLRDVKEQVRQLAERKYKERRAQIESNYRRQLDPVVSAERVRRVAAIAAFEAFLERHPDDREFVPDAMFRLAELYYEKTDDEFQVAIAEYRDAYAVWKDGGSSGEPPVEPAKRFERTIALYQKLINGFPEYRLLDGAYYLLGYTLRQQGDVENGLVAWQTLVANYPKSRFFAEVWFRIGDQHFDDEKWDDAIADFMHVVPVKTSDYYDKGLYKLAWTYYLVNRFDESVARFFELLDFSFAEKRADGEGGSVLEEEAVQYVAISFGDDNWKRGPEYKKLLKGRSLEDPDAEVETDYVRFARDWFTRAAGGSSSVGGAVGGVKPYERDVMAKLGDNLFRQSKHLQAVAALDRALELDPLHRDAPKLQDQVVQAWVRERQFEKAAAARDSLVKTYAKGSPWAKKFANDAEALKASEDYARTNLYSAALYYHQQATSYFNAERQDLGLQYFRLASDAYKDYLGRYPHDKNAYELAYYLAETYYYSLRFDDAVQQYEAVRDSTAGNKYRAESALNSVYSYEKILEDAQNKGTLEKREIAAGARDPNKKIEEIPALRRSYITSIDKFLNGGEQHEMAPAFGYRAGEIFYAYGQYDEGVKRFRTVVDKYPESEAARYAANLILDDMLARKDWKTASETAAAFADKKVGGEDPVEFRKIQSGARFNIAKETLENGQKLMDEGRIQDGITMLETGADSYLKLLDEDPKREFADVMMYNAALSFEKARRPLRAAGLYERLYQEYPTSEYAPEAMFRVANKSEQAFNFDKAVSTYLGLVKKYPTTERRADAQINAALALEGQQQYDKAAQEFERYATLFPEKPDAADVFFRASIVHKKRNNPVAEAAVLRRFIGRYSSSAALVPKVIEAHARLGDIFAEQAKKTPSAKGQSVDAYKSAVGGFARASGNPAAAYFAAKSAFALAEDDFNSYARLSITAKKSDKQVKELEAKLTQLQRVEEIYKKVILTYKAGEWSLAALYRIGSLYDNMQQTVLKSPCPDDIKRAYGDIGCDEYANAIEDKGFAVEEKAVANYKIAYDKAREFRLTNVWTKRTLEALNLLRPIDYPIDKDPLAKPSTAPVDDGLGLALPDGGAPELKALGHGPAELAQKTGT